MLQANRRTFVTNGVGPRSYTGQVAAKVLVQHVCTECGTASPRWLGKCPGCGAFGTLAEELHASEERRSARAGTPTPLGDVSASEGQRIPTGVPELDRVLGGGLVPASLVLVGGEPGVGKSTLLLSALGAIARDGRSALLVTGEESAAQVSLRAARLGGAETVGDPGGDGSRHRLRDARAGASRRVRDRLGADPARVRPRAPLRAPSPRCERPRVACSGSRRKPGWRRFSSVT